MDQTGQGSPALIYQTLKWPRGSRLFGAFLALAVLLSVPYAYAAAYTSIWFFDDEGPLMITCQNMKEGWRLYDDAYSLYGPFYYVVMAPLFTVLALPLTHDVARGVTMAFWLTNTALFAALVYRLTRSFAAGIMSFVVALFLLRIYTVSPLHPEELCYFLLAGLLHGLYSIERTPVRSVLFGLGFCLAGIVLTKINAGAFVAIPLLLVLARAAGGPRWTHAAAVALTIAAAVFPLILMHALLHFSWALRYCLFATTVMVTTLGVWWRTPTAYSLPIRYWVWPVIAMAVTTCVAIGGVLANGTTAFAILNTTILQNPRHILNWYQKMELHELAPFSAALGFVTAFCYCVMPRRSRWSNILISSTKLTFAAGVLGIFIYSAQRGLPSRDLPKLLFALVMPFCWLLIVPPLRSGVDPGMTRGALGLIAGFFVLYAFPVSGSQVLSSTLLPMVMLPVLLHDVAADFLTIRRPGRAAFDMAAAVMFAALLVSQTRFATATYAANVPLDLPGARRIHVSPEDRGTAHWLTDQLADCRSFFTMPGLFSLYFWTGKTTPTALNNNNLLAFFSAAQQDRVIAELSTHEDLCVVVAPDLIKFFDRGQVATDPPLLRYLHENYAPVAVRNSREIHKRRN